MIDATATTPDEYELRRTIHAMRVSLLHDHDAMRELARQRAIADALLGAAALGDLGTRFGVDDPALAGADSIFYGDTLLTTGNPAAEADRELLAAAGVTPWQG
jgi:hypothetical protein